MDGTPIVITQVLVGKITRCARYAVEHAIGRRRGSMMRSQNAPECPRAVPTASIEPIFEDHLTHEGMRWRVVHHAGARNLKPRLFNKFCPLRDLVLEAWRRLANVVDTSKPGNECRRCRVVTAKCVHDLVLDRFRQPFVPKLARNTRRINHMNIKRRPQVTLFRAAGFCP